MGGEGAMMQANQSLKSNRKLVGKRKENRFSFVHTSNEKTEYDLPKSSPKILLEIKNKIRRENKIRERKRFLLIGLFSLILIIVFTYFMF
ncbi:hypothetical protein [Lacinutrix sp. 5H-3-7-4]|uniref:hypothetical protein n=1 Tax=Lacinutrix sp. (strain 5H-3-7-4) TaxID=983544 RepID=UPI00020A37C7|nr:hypothetical protein [Lacinutrix sp. 5H-3-7-4]AEH00371.1 hypothetical protein Lacal_0519 [Lacinutrix sp. 5H-3-7-4]